eukprot:4506449-Amphidinium_carterae.1
MQQTECGRVLTAASDTMSTPGVSSVKNRPRLKGATLHRFSEDIGSSMAQRLALHLSWLASQTSLSSVRRDLNAGVVAAGRSGLIAGVVAARKSGLTAG